MSTDSKWVPLVRDRSEMASVRHSGTSPLAFGTCVADARLDAEAALYWTNLSWDHWVDSPSRHGRVHLRNQTKWSRADAALLVSLRPSRPKAVELDRTP